MAKQLSIGSVLVFDETPKHQHYYYSNLTAPSFTKPQTRYSFTFRPNPDQEKPKKNGITEKEMADYVSWKENVAAERRQLQDSCLLRDKDAPPAGSDPDHAFLDSYPFTEEPVRFEFGDDYGGDRLFLDLRREVLHGNVSAAASTRLRARKCFVSGDDDDVDSLATDTDMVNLFLKDNLF